MHAQSTWPSAWPKPGLPETDMATVCSPVLVIVMLRHQSYLSRTVSIRVLPSVKIAAYLGH